MVDQEAYPVYTNGETNSIHPPFPFPAHTMRDGEPQYPTFHEQTEQEDNQTFAWLTWAMSQPDSSLLVADYHHRSMWEASEGKVSKRFLKDWIHERRLNAIHLKKIGYSDILKTCWASNTEFDIHSPNQLDAALNTIMTAVSQFN